MSGVKMKYTRFCYVFTFFLLILNACGDEKSTQSSLDEASQELSSSADIFTSSSGSDVFSSSNLVEEKKITVSSCSSFSISDESSSSQRDTIISVAKENSSNKCVFDGKWEFLSNYFNCDSLVVNVLDSIWFGRGRPDYDSSLQWFSKETCQHDFPQNVETCILNDFYYTIEQMLELDLEFERDSVSDEYVGCKYGYEGYVLKYDNHLPKKEVQDFTIIVTNNASLLSSSSETSSSSEISSSSISSSSVSSSSKQISSSSVVVSSSSYFVIPDSLVNTPRTISLNEIEEALKESLYRNLFATDTFRYDYSMSGRAQTTPFSQNYYFISKGRDKLYYQQSLDYDYLKKTRIIINGTRKKVIFVNDGTSRVGSVTQEYIDSVRTEFKKVFNNPLDSGVWYEPEQITDSIYRVRSDAGAELYYNAYSKKCEMWTETRMMETDGEKYLADYEFRYEYEDGYVQSQKMKAVSHSTRVGDVQTLITISVSNVKSSADFSDEMFEF